MGFNESFVSRDCKFGTGELWDDLGYPSDYLRVVNFDPAFVRIVSRDVHHHQSMNTNLQPAAVEEQVDELLLLEVAALPPMENGP